VRMIREICWGSAQLWSSEKQVPQHFSDADNIKVHSGLFDAQLFLDLGSSGTPLVSGTNVFILRAESPRT